MKVISTFKHPVSLSIRCSPTCYDAGIDSAYNIAVNKFNEYHTGQKYFPFDEPIPPTKSGTDLKDLHHRLFASTAVEVIVELLEDGSLRVKKDQGNLDEI